MIPHLKTPPLIPQLKSPPRVRVEWLIAGARVLLAVGTAIVGLLANTEPGIREGIPKLIPSSEWYLWYLSYSLMLLAMVWTPIRFGRGWDVAIHLVDILALLTWMMQPDSVINPVVVYFVFVVVCGTIRWQGTGTLWTSVAAIGLQTAISLYHASPGSGVAFVPVTFATRIAYLALIAALVAYLGEHQNRFQYEISRLASWPRKPARDAREILSEILRQSSEFLGAPRMVLVWEEPGEGWINVVWQNQEQVMWTREPEATYGAFVLPALEHSTFQVNNASEDRGRVMVLRSTGFRRRNVRPVNESLRARFEMVAVQSWPLRGELVRGRMFCLDKARMRLDDLILGEVVAWLALTRLETLYWQDRLRDAAALDERIRLARDLHDSLLQAQAGAALQLVAARRLLERDLAAGKQRLADVQAQLERDELEIRSFVSRLRPANRLVAGPDGLPLRDRLEELTRRVERQWEIHVKLQMEDVDRLPEEVAEGAYRLVQEGVVNAARHADASVIDVTVSRTNGSLKLQVADDGRGFPFHGSFDLSALNAMDQGPLTLKERVAELGGDLLLKSGESGTEMIITLPLARPHI